jgi:hypothetical protein
LNLAEPRFCFSQPCPQARRDIAEGTGGVVADERKAFLNPRRRLKLIIGSAAVVIALRLVVFCLDRRGSTIVYRDKSLDYWFGQTFMTMVQTNGSSSQVVRINWRPGVSYGCSLEKPEDMRGA